MDNSTLPPLFDNMDNVDISSPNEESEIFQSAIQVRLSFVFLLSTLFGFKLARTQLSNYSYDFHHNFFFAKLLSLRCLRVPQRPFIYAGCPEMNKFLFMLTRFVFNHRMMMSPYRRHQNKTEQWKM